MGRDVAGLRIDNKPSVVNVNSKSPTHGAVHVAPKISPQEVGKVDRELDNHIKNDYLPDEHNRNRDVQDIKNTYHELEEKIIRVEVQIEDQKSPDSMLSSWVKTTSRSAINGNSLEPLSPNGKTEKQISCNSDLNCSAQSTDLQTSKTNEELQLSSPMVNMKQQHLRNKNKYDEEDDRTETSGRKIKPKVTIPVAPKFCCGDRLERRKKFYSKLEEKNKAIEKEKLEYEARMKEEEQTALKKLRKSMVYKANPVPSFYREGPPPKIELKKLPVTRAKSPNLTRRKSCSDEVKTYQEDIGFHERATRHSVGVCKEGKNSHIP